MNSSSKYASFSGNKAGIISAFIICVLFIIFSVAMVNRGGSYLWFIPPALVAVAVAFTAIDKFLLFTVLLVPVSVQLIFIVPEASADLFLPTELMLAGILVLMLFKLFIGKEINREILRHPATIISFCLIGWSLFTSVSSTIPVVSLKSFVAKTWFFAGFYLLAAQVFMKQERIRTYFRMYLAGMVPVVIYYLARMWQAGIFNQKMAYKAIRPFFNDHTSFGAALAFCIPVMTYFLTTKKMTLFARFTLLLVLLLFTAAFVFSYSRAAWLSFVIAGVVVFLLYFRISWKIVLPIILALSVFTLISLSDILIQLRQNRQDSSSDFGKHLQSISNIRSDASNVERLNRWNCAIRMFREKPLLGWGPATFQFNYAPFQIAAEKTIISTNYGEGGNAHSEYLGLLVDSGIPGLIFYMLLLIVSITRGIIIFKTQTDRQLKYLSLALVAGLITYVVHGAMNNFLDTDKISCLFWGMIAGIVALDIQIKRKRPGNGSPEVGRDN